MGGQPIGGQKAYNSKYATRNKERIAEQRAAYRQSDEYREWLDRTRTERTIKATAQQKIRKESSHVEWLKYSLKTAKSRKSKSGIAKECTIILQDLVDKWDEQNGICAISGLKMNYITESLLSISIDRIDNSIGYTRDNTHLVCRWVNLGRGPCSLVEMRQIINDLKSNH